MAGLQRTVVPLFALFALAGAARASDTRIESAEACARIAADAERLRCFDGLFGGGAGAQPELTAEDRFGLAVPERSDSAPAEIASRVTRVIPRGLEPPLLELENGQQWLLLESPGNARFNAGTSITIRSGAMGSYLASMPERKGSWRVRRVQ